MITLNELSHPIVIAILALALFVYYRLVYAFIARKQVCCCGLGFWQQSLNLCICALPLLGLLGTIMGLLDAFVAMSYGETMGFGNSLTAGISDALFTTQLGLLLAVPAWILYSLVNRSLNEVERHAS
ncbi:MAG: MotA/TolQ/ExbB proton channel family protein [Pseudoalteromonas spongiae]|uniref:MotA/TolQ/ExbB proton channel family protein n=1 Tax=Pseudoalteromonas spongiae TaxID=298657 RepID=UPI000C2D1C1A|nr:MotA/TolQ/ExbB proton channel family protein [Pseudoalteromonas spongiae]MEC8324590.1 MotA/TolQ/ExbB proton channel family protein [Pseudomonadota bacterium]